MADKKKTAQTGPAGRERVSRLKPLDEDLASVAQAPETPQTQAPAYRLAFLDEQFLKSDELRGVRLQLELMKPETILRARGIESTVILFGGARIPEPGATPAAKTKAARESLADASRFYDEARRFAAAVSKRSLETYGREWVVVTGGGPGVMEAGNRGAMDVGAHSIGLNIVLKNEPTPNAYVTPDLCFNFHYFAIRKMHFLMRAKAIAIFPGGFGTLDELFEVLTLIQTERMRRVPIVLFGEAFWRKIINFEALAEAGTISPEDLDLFTFVETADDALRAIDATL